MQAPKARCASPEKAWKSSNLRPTATKDKRGPFIQKCIWDYELAPLSNWQLGLLSSSGDSFTRKMEAEEKHSKLGDDSGLLQQNRRNRQHRLRGSTLKLSTSEQAALVCCVHCVGPQAVSMLPVPSVCRKACLPLACLSMTCTQTSHWGKTSSTSSLQKVQELTPSRLTSSGFCT